MTTDFNNCVFTIFCVDELSSVFNAVKDTYLNNKKNKVTIRMNETDMEKYLNPKYGGAHLPEFCCWKNANYPDKVFFISNYIDGMTNLCGIIRAKLNCKLIMCHLSNGLEYPAYSFKMINAEGKERIILAYKEDRWVFYEVGYPLPFEDVELYKKGIFGIG